MSEVKLAQAEIHQQSCEAELEALKAKSNDNIPASCIPFAEYSGVHQIKVSGMDAFDVLCDSQFAGSGWIVIQQRVGGDENFNRDWNSYRDGFGSFESDFFLGLEKIHLLTKWRRYELFIHLVDVKGGVRHARYDDFKLSDEEHGYALQLGGFSGNVWEALRSGEKMKFSTFDRDNDASTHNCADLYKSGWWYSKCYNSNLNALYGPDLNWFKSQPIKEAKMLIRPRD
ncbi:fibrinogen-like protein 1 [Drosophila nasuta]|uniref:fibrinogen-like protein 1 n=1 Tax=Drosophila nasuta TaxID=42062 RepID=UPI00295F0C6C|nr:fibrinogen-like protein 1 [Drosophila nasuta]